MATDPVRTVITRAEERHGAEALGCPLLTALSLVWIALLAFILFEIFKR